MRIELHLNYVVRDEGLDPDFETTLLTSAISLNQCVSKNPLVWIPAEDLSIS